MTSGSYLALVVVLASHLALAQRTEAAAEATIIHSVDSTKQGGNSSVISLQPEPALPALLQLFDTYQVVGLADLHGCAELFSFVEQLIRAPEFAERVNDITWEPGNARFQELMDDFILRGKELSFHELSPCWRNNTQVHTYSDTPALFHLLQTVRQVNLALPAARRIRVLLIDPPIDWARIRSQADVRPQDFDRESHMAEVLEREVYAKGRKALFFAGGAHLGRGGAEFHDSVRAAGGGPVILPFAPGARDVLSAPKGPPNPAEESISQDTLADGLTPAKSKASSVQVPFQAESSGPSAPGPAAPHSPPVGPINVHSSARRELFTPLQTVERRHPGTTFNIGLHEGFGAQTKELETKLASWPKPGLARLRGTWWGLLAPAPTQDIFVARDGQPVSFQSNRRIQDNWDAVLFLGNRMDLTRAQPPGVRELDLAWLTELQRRKAILGGPPIVIDRSGKKFAPQYFSKENLPSDPPPRVP